MDYSSNPKRIWAVFAVVALVTAILGWFAAERGTGRNASSQPGKDRSPGSASVNGQRASISRLPASPLFAAAGLPANASQEQRAEALAAAARAAAASYPPLTATAEYQTLPVADHRPQREGEMATAFVAVPSTGKKLRLEPNQLGEFPRVRMEPSESVGVHLVFPEAAPGALYTVAAQDGGIIEQSGQPGHLLALDSQRTLFFKFQASSNTGFHRLKIRSQGGENQLLEFWAGDTEPVFNTAFNRNGARTPPSAANQ